MRPDMGYLRRPRDQIIFQPKVILMLHEYGLMAHLSVLRGSRPCFLFFHFFFFHESHFEVANDTRDATPELECFG